MNCHWISMGNLLWGGNLAITSNPCERQTIWPRSMKFWYKKRQSIFFKGKFISNLYLLASQRKSLTESIIWGGWPCIFLLNWKFTGLRFLKNNFGRSVCFQISWFCIPYAKRRLPVKVVKAKKFDVFFKSTWKQR